MDKVTLINILKGGTCEHCRYCLKRIRIQDGYSGTEELNPPHCSLRTTHRGQPTERSQIPNYPNHSCPSFWKKEA